MKGGRGLTSAKPTPPSAAVKRRSLAIVLSMKDASRLCPARGNDQDGGGHPGAREYNPEPARRQGVAGVLFRSGSASVRLSPNPNQQH